MGVLQGRSYPSSGKLYGWIKEYIEDFQHGHPKTNDAAMGLKSPAPIQSRLNICKTRLHLWRR